MNKKSLARHALKLDPFSPGIPTEAIHLAAPLEHFWLQLVLGDPPIGLALAHAHQRLSVVVHLEPPVGHARSPPRGAANIGGGGRLETGLRRPLGGTQGDVGVAPLPRSRRGSNTPITRWPDYADPAVAPLRRSRSGSIRAVADAPDGQAFEQARALAEEALEEVRVDGGARRLIWPDGDSLTIGQSVQRIGKTTESDGDVASERIEEEVCAWLEGGYAPDDLTPEQFDELDDQVELWLEEHRRAKGGSND